MAVFSEALLLILSLGFASARQCQNLTVSVSISANNGVFNVAIPQSNIDVTNLILNGVQQGHNATQEVLSGYQTISGTYDIAATYCVPDKGDSGVIQLATHGIGFDRSYWDFSYANYNYSYAEVAVDQYGYSLFTWDRLGIGMSEHLDPLNDVQAPLEQAALYALTQGLREGSIKGCSANAQKIIHVGHSFGSELSYGLSRDYPTATDGLVLTGFSQNGTFLPYFQLGGNFISSQSSPLASQYVAGYLAAGDVSAVQTNFLAPDDFDPNVLALAFATGQPVSVGELLTVAGEAMGVNEAAVPVLIVTGQRDLPYCGGDCTITGSSLPNIPSSSQQYLPNAKPFQVEIITGAGHGLNLQYSHTTTYSVISNFLVQNGLAAS